MTRMHYVTCRSHGIKKHKVGITCPGAFLWDPHLAHPSMKIMHYKTYRFLQNGALHDL
jgi:hypothetical protein